MYIYIYIHTYIYIYIYYIIICNYLYVHIYIYMKGLPSGKVLTYIFFSTKFTINNPLKVPVLQMKNLI